MINYAKHVKISKKLKKNEDHIKNKILHRKIVPGVYVIAFSTNENNLFDIISANELLFPIYHKIDLCIVGIAKGKQEAIAMTKDLIDNVYKETNSFDVRSFYN